MDITVDTVDIFKFLHQVIKLPDDDDDELIITQDCSGFPAVEPWNCFLAECFDGPQYVNHLLIFKFDDTYIAVFKYGSLKGETWYRLSGEQPEREFSSISLMIVWNDRIGFRKTRHFSTITSGEILQLCGNDYLLISDAFYMAYYLFDKEGRFLGEISPELGTSYNQIHHTISTTKRLVQNSNQEIDSSPFSLICGTQIIEFKLPKEIYPFYPKKINKKVEEET